MSHLRTEVLQKRIEEINAIMEESHGDARFQLIVEGASRGQRAMRYHVRIHHRRGPLRGSASQLDCGIFVNAMTAADLLYTYLSARVAEKEKS